MGTLYLDRRNLSLRLDGKRLVIEEPDARPRGVPLALLERVVLRGLVQFDSGVLGALAEQGTAVVCLSARHSRRTALLLGPGHGDARRRLAQYQLALD
ncbi:MAG: CRISPR-associated endonuclease Cas1, partial [Candidatus Contendobacter sp.]